MESAKVIARSKFKTRSNLAWGAVIAVSVPKVGHNFFPTLVTQLAIEAIFERLTNWASPKRRFLVLDILTAKG